MLKKILLSLSLFAMITNSFAYCVSNRTDHELYAKVSYKDWWMDHSKWIPAHSQLCETYDLKPDQVVDIEIGEDVYQAPGVGSAIVAIVTLGIIVPMGSEKEYSQDFNSVSISSNYVVEGFRDGDWEIMQVN